MAFYIAKRFLSALFTLLLISFILFVLIRIMPGDPFPVERMSFELILLKREQLGLNLPIYIQFFNYMSALLIGDFGAGTSLYNGAPISR